MTNRSDAHEKLVEDAAKRIEFLRYKGSPPASTSEWLARTALAIVYERLQTLTPEMAEAWDRSRPVVSGNRDEYIMGRATADWQAMLAASPLCPPKAPSDG